jgi:hypothetical protein
VLLRAAGDQRGQRIRDYQANERRHQCIDQRLDEDLRVDGLREEPDITVDVEIGLAVFVEQRSQAAELARCAKRRQHHDQRRNREEQQQIENGRPADQPFA